MLASFWGTWDLRGFFSLSNQRQRRVVVIAKQQELETIKDVHEGVGQSTYSNTMASYKGRELVLVICL